MLDIIAALIGKMFFFTGYVREGSFPEPLSADEEAAVIKRMLAGDVAARGELIERNLRLVAHIAKKYASPRRDADDLISIGTIGLIKAVSTYNREKSSTLATYASRCIDNEILMSLRSEKKRALETSLSEPIGSDGDGNDISLSEVLGSDEDLVPDEALKNIASDRLTRAVEETLGGREKTVIKLRYGLDGGKRLAQREVAQLLRISRSYVSRIEKKALQKLSSHLSQLLDKM